MHICCLLESVHAKNPYCYEAMLKKCHRRQARQISRDRSAFQRAKGNDSAEAGFDTMSRDFWSTGFTFKENNSHF